MSNEEPKSDYDRYHAQDFDDAITRILGIPDHDWEQPRISRNPVEPTAYEASKLNLEIGALERVTDVPTEYQRRMKEYNAHIVNPHSRDGRVSRLARRIIGMKDLHE